MGPRWRASKLESGETILLSVRAANAICRASKKPWPRYNDAIPVTLDELENMLGPDRRPHWVGLRLAKNVGPVTLTQICREVQRLRDDKHCRCGKCMGGVLTDAELLHKAMCMIEVLEDRKQFPDPIGNEVAIQIRQRLKLPVNERQDP